MMKLDDMKEGTWKNNKAFAKVVSDREEVLKRSVVRIDDATNTQNAKNRGRYGFLERFQSIKTFKEGQERIE